MANKFENLIGSTLSSNLYPGYFKRSILNKAKKAGLIIDDKDDKISLSLTPEAVNVSEFPTIEDKLVVAMSAPEVQKLFEKQILRKQYRHFCYFEFRNIDSDKLSTLIDKGLVVNELFFTGYSDSTDFSKPYISRVDDQILIEFKRLLSDKDGNEILYPIVVCFDLKLKIVEIRFDKIGISFKDDHGFYKTEVNKIRNWINANLGEELQTIDFKAVIEFLKRKDTNLTVYAQKMKRNKYDVYLESLEDDEITMPILGELKALIKKYDDLFNESGKTRDIREILHGFINKIEIDSDIPEVKVRFDDLKVKVGITHNYKDSDFSLFQYHEDLTKPKEVVDNVREFFIKYYKELGQATTFDPLSNEST